MMKYLLSFVFSVLVAFGCKPLPESLPEIRVRDGSIENAMLYGKISQQTFTGPAVVSGYDDYDVGMTEIKVEAENDTGIGMVILYWGTGNLADLTPGTYEIARDAPASEPEIILCAGETSPWYLYDTEADSAILTVTDSQAARTFEIRAQTTASEVIAVFQVR